MFIYTKGGTCDKYFLRMSKVGTENYLIFHLWKFLNTKECKIILGWHLFYRVSRVLRLPAINHAFGLSPLVECDFLLANRIYKDDGIVILWS